jgi:hypothetical protein
MDEIVRVVWRRAHLWGCLATLSLTLPWLGGIVLRRQKGNIDAQPEKLPMWAAGVGNDRGAISVFSLPWVAQAS